MAAARAVGEGCDTSIGGGLLPRLGDVHDASRRIGVGDAIDEAEAERRLAERWWEPEHRSVIPRL